jgi:hypothetical protein
MLKRKERMKSLNNIVDRGKKCSLLNSNENQNKKEDETDVFLAVSSPKL